MILKLLRLIHIDLLQINASSEIIIKTLKLLIGLIVQFHDACSDC